MPIQAKTLAELFRYRCSQSSESLAYAFVRDTLELGQTLSWSELQARVARLTHVLLSQTTPGSRILLLYPPGLDIVIAFWACIQSGLIPVPAPPPEAIRRKHSLPRLRAIIDDAQAAMVLTTTGIHALSTDLVAGRESDKIVWLRTDDLPVDICGEHPDRVSGTSLAYLQYTSGSTATPRGVMISHRNVLAQCEGIRMATGVDAQSRSLCWLPYYHDYGLVHGILAPLYAGIPAYLMSPVTFLRRPLRWLEAIERFGITHSGAPNFAYQACLRALQDRAEWSCHLGSWKVASCGAEPIRAETIEAFSHRFEVYGFEARAFTPAYGLAESTLVVSTKPLHRDPTILEVSAEGLANHRIEVVEPRSTATRRLVGCGEPLGGTTIRIVDPKSRLDSMPGQIGEVWISGESIAEGYWSRNDETRNTFHAVVEGSPDTTYLRTGDLGFLHGGQLYLTGRLKDLIILNGRNLYPNDIEETVERCHVGLRANGAAAFAVDGEQGEALVIVQEIDRPGSNSLETLVETIRQAVMQEHLALVSTVVLVRTGSLPKTASGKVQRHLTRTAFENGTLPVVSMNRIGRPATSVLLAETSMPASQQAAKSWDRPSVEQYLREVCATVLQVEVGKIDVTRSVSALGIDSLNAGLIKSRLEEDLGVEVSFGRLLAGETLEDLAEFLLLGSSRAVPNQASTTASHSGSVQREPVASFPLSPSQLRFWFAERMQPQSTVNSVAVAVRLEGRLDAEIFEACLQRLIDRHEQLRVTFHEQHGELHQVIQDARAVTLQREDLRGLSGHQQTQALDELLLRESRHRFDLTQGPLLHAVLIQIEPNVAVFLLVVHHMVIDGWSLRVLCRELSARYRAAIAGQTLALPLPPVRYHDYVLQQQSWLSAGRRERQLAYWTQQLRHVAPMLPLRIHLPKGLDTSAPTGRVAEVLSAEEVSNIDVFCRQRGVTRFALFCGLYVSVLSRYAGQRDMTIGAPVACRRGTSAESLVGCLVNTVALRFSLSDELSGNDLMSYVQCVVTEAADHQDVPFDEVIRALRVEEPGRSGPLFSAMIVFDDQSLEDLSLPGVSVSRQSVPPVDIPVDLVFLVSRRGEGLKLAIEYRQGRYGAEGVGQLLGEIRTLLEWCLSHANQRVSAYWHGGNQSDLARAVFPPVEDRTMPPYHSVLERFREQVTHTPAAHAVVTPQHIMTYEDLDCRSNRIARYLQGKGVRQGTVVGLCVDRSPDMAATLLGIWKAGGAYLPLDPELPAARLSDMMERSGLSVLVTQLALRPRLPSYGGPTVDLDLEGPDIASCDGAPLPVIPEADDLAYVMYTSGSTGVPKGVAVTHGNVAHSTRARALYYEQPVGRFLFTAPLGFDSSAIGLYWTWCTGGTLVIPSEDDQGDVDAILHLLDHHRITHVAWGPAWHRLLLQRVSPAQGKSLRVVIVGGEVLPAELVRQHYDLLPHAMLYNEYGPTEATVWSVVHRVSKEDGGARVPIGREIAGTQVLLLDEQLRPVSPGSIGEICIGGSGIAKGYWNDPERTAVSFVQRVDGKPGRLYRTGDLGLRRDDGLLEFVGRRDQQVKVRGFRIELEEVEAVLRRAPGVSDAAVLCRELPSRETGLIAYVTPQPGVTLISGDVRKAIQSWLPSYMLPSSIVVLPVFPTTASGKVDRQALPNPEVAAVSSDPVPIAPRDHVEDSLREMWSQMLGAPVAGIHEDFFELGGHSLLATQLVSRIREVFEVELPLRQFFEYPTIAALGEVIRDAQRQARGQRRLPPIQPVDRSQPLPLSSSQQRMWVLHHMAPQSPAYNMLFVSRQIGPLKRAAIRRSAEALVARHESFRTTFAMSESGPVQRVSPLIRLPWGEADLRLLPASQRLAEAHRLAKEEACRPFDLEHGPLVRFFLIQLDAEDHLLVLTMHHIISDQWSFGVLGREFAMHYNACVREQELHLSPLQIQYGDFAVWQQRCLQDASLEPQREYWKRQLAGLQTLSLPTDYSRPAAQTFSGSFCSMDLSASLIRQVEAFSAERHVTPFMTLLACFCILLGRYAGSADVAVGSPIANRTQGPIEGLIGTFVNTLVLRLNLSGDPTFSECVARVRELALDAYANQDFPFEKLVEEVQAVRDPSYGPLVQVLFNVGNAPVGDVNLHGLTWVPFEVDTGSAQFDLSLTVETVFARKAYLTFNTDLFDRATAQRMLMHYRVLLHQAVGTPDVRCSALGWLTPAEERTMVCDWNKTSAEFPAQRCVGEVIAEQADRSPGAVALSMDGETVTYRELNSRANQLARRLAALGVSSTNTVGVCLERSFDMVVAVLAVWKAGGNYVPLDPDYPRERLRFMLEDSGAVIVVTTGPLFDRLFEPGTRALCLDIERHRIDQEAPQNLPRAAAAEDLAYVLYTSGSTGLPKGVEITHRALMNFLWAMRQRPGCGPHDVVLAVTTLSFDIAGLELYLPLMVGGRVEIASRAVATDGAQLRDRLEAVGATIMQATPATWRLLLAVGWAGRPSLTALCGGEAFPPDLAAQLLARTRRVWNMYGPTETTIWSTVSQLETGEQDITIGRPIANTAVYILDERQAPVPVGVPGELYIGGQGVARGYRNRPDLTAERFMPDPFARDPLARMYRTGDRARFLADGRIVHLGRLDHQVKIRGFRIELGEIEAVFGRHPAVRQVVVVAREDEAGEKYLAAYVVRVQGQTVEVHELHQWAKVSLPDYMIPAAYVFLEALPLTANNKVDVRALPVPQFAETNAGQEHIGPRSLIEVQLVALWQQVLSVREIGIHENFFDLGGHSLKAAQLFYLLEQVYGRSLPLATLFHAPTIAELAAVLTREHWNPPWQSLVAIQPQGTGIPLFMVPGVGGNVLIFAQLAKCLGPDQPVYGLQARGLDGQEAPFTSVPEMASYYVSEIQGLRPQGPYVIAGACTGGLIAYEIARQLQAQGHLVKLAMLDTWHPSSYRRDRGGWLSWPVSLGALLEWGKHEARSLLAVPFRAWGGYFVARILAALGRARPDLHPEGRDTEYQVERVTRATFQAVASYEVKPYHGLLLNCVASERPVGDAVPDTRHGWARSTGPGSQTVYVAATDSGRLFVPPFVETVAHHLSDLIQLPVNQESKQGIAQEPGRAQ